MKTYKIVKELGPHGTIVWRVMDPRDLKSIASYYTLRACIGYLMTLGKIVSKKMTKPGCYNVKVKVTEFGAENALREVLR